MKIFNYRLMIFLLLLTISLSSCKTTMYYVMPEKLSTKNDLVTEYAKCIEVLKYNNLIRRNNAKNH